MVSFDGNTAPYLLYAYTRVMGIFRKGNIGEEEFYGQVVLAVRAERDLAIHLLRFPETVKQTASEAAPHHLCGYLYMLAGLFMTFYETCPVLGGEGPLRESRLKLSLLTARTLSMGLSLLGIGTLDRM